MKNPIPEKHMWRFFTESAIHENQNVTLKDEERHLLQVLRLSHPDEIEITDGKGKIARAQILHIDRKEAICKVTEISNQQHPDISLTLYLGRSKQSALEESIGNAAQLGCSRMQIVETDKNASSLGKSNRQNLRFDRLYKIALESVRISKNPWFPTVKDKLISIEEVLDECEFRKAPLFVCDETPLHTQNKNEHMLLMRAVLREKGTANLFREICLFVGPESGFSENEKVKILTIGQQKNQKVYFVSLGNNILTVPNAVTSALTLAAAALEF